LRRLRGCVLRFAYRLCGQALPAAAINVAGRAAPAPNDARDHDACHGRRVCDDAPLAAQ
jgi:hypothetical protein